MSTLLGLKNTIIAAIIALVIGFCGGYYIKAKFNEADRVKVAEKIVNQAAKEIVVAQKTNEVVAKTVAKSNANSSAIRKAAAKHLIPTEKTDAEPPAQPTYIETQTCSVRTLDVFTVGLLNDARTNSPLGSSIGSNAEGKTPSDITLADFVDNDLEVVQQYHELATRHDALVDYVERLIENQAK